MKKKIDYFDVRDLLKQYANYYIIFGQRGNGKSWSVARSCIDKFFIGLKENNYNSSDSEFVVIKRLDEEMKKKNVETMFDDHVEYVKEKYGYNIRYSGGKWFVYPNDEKPSAETMVVMCHGMCLNATSKFKGTQYPRVKHIIFEEFMSMDNRYLPNELNLLLNTVSTVFRNRTDCKVFLLGNAIGRVNPYSKSLNVRFDKMEHGSVKIYKFKNDQGYSTTILVNRCNNVDVFNTDDNITRMSYNVFGNSGVGSMITTGDFEIGTYKKHLFNITLKSNLAKIPPSQQGFYSILDDDETIIDKVPIGTEYESNDETIYKYVGEHGEDMYLERTSKIPYATNVYLSYEGFLYRVFLKYEHGVPYLCGFVDTDVVDNRNLCLIINSLQFIPNTVTINDFNWFESNDGYNYKVLKHILNLMGEGKFIVESNEDGENVVEAMIACGHVALRNKKW